MSPTQIQDCIDLAYKVVRRNHRRKIKRIKELTLPVFLPPHHRSIPVSLKPNKGNHASAVSSIGVLQHIHP